MKIIFPITVVLLLSLLSACRADEAKSGVIETAAKPTAAPAPVAPSPVEKPKVPSLQAEILDDRNKTTASALGKFDFKNFKYPLPRGWQGGGMNEIVLENGKVRASEEKIGASLATVKYMDATGDGQDEAFVVLKIDTGGSAVPQIVYIFENRGEKPELLWYFRTGDRADGGLKDFRIENGELVVELYGQDRYLAGELETLKIAGDEEQICCPTHFTQTRYKQNGKFFKLQGKRLTYSMSDKTALPVENMGEIIEQKENDRRKAKR